MRYFLGVLILAGAILGHGILVGAQSNRVPGIEVYRAGIFCVFVSASGVAVIPYEVYDVTTRFLVQCPAVTSTTPPMILRP